MEVTMPPTDRSSRLDSIDLLRGLVMVVMALDHVKGNFWNGDFDPTNLAHPHAFAFAFVTRWITHFCAPTFVLLAGTGSYLFGARRQSKGQLSWFLFSRGLWLVILELTVIRFSWSLEVHYLSAFGQVIWVIGLSMIAMSGLIHLPMSTIVAFGVAMIGLHNSFDDVRATELGRYAWIWKILHTGESITINPGVWNLQNCEFSPFYPLVPWIGVMMVGYGLGGIMTLEPARRRRELLGLGLSLIAIFFVLRMWNIYGDKPTRFPGTPGPWSEQRSDLFTVFSFVNCQKYPPSLCYLLMTLGPAITALALFEYVPANIGKPLVILGRVPMFFYLLHWYLIKGLAILISYIRFDRFDWLWGEPRGTPPSNDRFDLWGVYLIWLTVIVLLYPLCWWYAGVKRRSKSVWLSYL
jgi:uncharacterized membrane protein